MMKIMKMKTKIAKIQMMPNDISTNDTNKIKAVEATVNDKDDWIDYLTTPSNLP